MQQGLSLKTRSWYKSTGTFAGNESLSNNQSNDYTKFSTTCIKFCETFTSCVKICETHIHLWVKFVNKTKDRLIFSPHDGYWYMKKWTSIYFIFCNDHKYNFLYHPIYIFYHQSKVVTLCLSHSFQVHGSYSK